jgi:hypothetical protein
MPKRKKKAATHVHRSESQDRYLAEAEFWIKQLSEAKTKTQRQEIRARMKRYIDQ